MGLIEALVLRRVTLSLVRMIRRLIVFLAVIVGLGLVASAMVQPIAERKIGETIQRALKLDTPPTVRLDAFPILLRAAQGRVPGLTVDGRDLVVQGLRLSRYRVEMDDVAVSYGSLIAGEPRVQSAGGLATATLRQDAVNAYLASRKETARITFLDGAVRARDRARYLGRVRDLEAVGALSIVGHDLVFEAQRVTVDGKPPPRDLAERARRDAGFRQRLPAVFGGIRARRIVVEPTGARLLAEFGPSTIDLTKV